MWLMVIGVLLILLKLAGVGPFETLSWWWVLSPFPVAVVWWEFADKSGYTKKREMDKMDEKKAERRQRQLDAIGQGDKTRKKR
jgi:small Trp-rich protein